MNVAAVDGAELVGWGIFFIGVIMKKLNRLCYFLFIIFINANLNAYIINIIKLEKPGCPTIYMFSDLHKHSPDLELISDEQKQALYQVLSRIDPQDFYVIVEDCLGYSGNNPEIIRFLQNCYAITPQSGLSLFCMKNNIPVTNLDYRFTRHASLGGVWKLIDRPVHPISNRYKILSKEIVKELDDAVLYMAQFDDPELNDYYNEIFGDIVEKSKYLDEMNRFDGPIDEYILKNVPASARQYFARSLECWDAQFLDIAALHSIYGYSGKGKILMFAGFLHTNSVAKALGKYLGYKKTSIIGQDVCLNYSKHYFSSELPTMAAATKSQTLDLQMLLGISPVNPKDIASVF